MNITTNTIAKGQLLDSKVPDRTTLQKTLLGYLERHPVLEEPCAAATTIAIWPILFLTTLAVAFLWGVIISRELIEPLYNSIVEHVAWLAVIGLIGTCVLFVSRVIDTTMRSQRIVYVRNGELVISSPYGYEFVPLGRLYWYSDYCYKHTFLVSDAARPCIVVRQRGRHRIILVGMTDELYSVWAAFLVINGVPQCRTRWRSRPLLIVLGALLGHVGSWVLQPFAITLASQNEIGIALSLQLCVLVPIMTAVYGSVVAGDDWFVLEGPSVYVYWSFLCAGLSSMWVGFMDGWLGGLTWISVWGVVGVLFAYCMGGVTRRCRRR